MINHVVVLMLENRSFDHMLGDLQRIDQARGVNGIDPNNPGTNPNPGGGNISQTNDALFALPKNFDPKHEHPDVTTQLGSLTNPTMQGFVQDAYENYGKKFPKAVNQVMSYFPFGPTFGNDKLPALQGLAREFLVCDNWFSSVPGPTWPNRFFALTGTCAGHLRMPEDISDIGLLFKSYDMPTIFNRLLDAGHSCKIFHDGVSLSMLLRQTWKHGDIYAKMDEFDEMADGEERDFPEFAFIEPRYFPLLFGTQNDQHPPSDVRYGDQLVARVYNKIRGNASLWNSTLLVVLYDEHGGFYDHVAPPATIPPDTLTDPAFPNFNFNRLGVRVPAILVSPWVKRGGVDHTVYDHTSLLKYLCDKWQLAPLGARCADVNTNTFASQILQQPNTNSPLTVPVVTIPGSRDLIPPSEQVNDHQRALAWMVDFVSDQLLEGNPSSPTRAIERGDLHSTEAVLRKADQVFTRLKANAAPLRIRPPTINTASAAVAPPVAGAREAGRPMRVFMVHGIGHGDVRTIWQEQWKSAFRESASAAGYATPDTIEFKFAEFDEIFDRYPLDGATIASGLITLGHDVFGPSPVFGTRELAQKGLIDIVRWTAGMTLQWIENATLRNELCNSLLTQFTASNCDIVCAHSLGSMACYDAFRREIASQRVDQFTGKYFLTFGSQIANPAVQSVFGGRIEPLHNPAGRGFTKWFHLFNPHDAVFTRPLPSGDAQTQSLIADFDIPGDLLNHDGDWYLKNQTTKTIVMPQMLPSSTTRELQAPAVLPKRRAQRRALLVGINDYPDPSMQLNGCVNDVYLMSAVLQECGFNPDDIRVLTDRRATRSALLDRLEWLSDSARPGDERVFFYSGHGAQMPAYGISGEPDHQCETLVPVDFDWSREHAFTDHEFRAYYSHLPYDTEFLAILDCCHAGGMARGGQRVRGIEPPDDLRHRELRWNPRHQMWVPRDFAERTPGKGRSFAMQTYSKAQLTWTSTNRSGLGESSGLRLQSPEEFSAATQSYGHLGPYMPVLIFAARENELAAEYEHGSVSYGAFTFTLTKQLRQYRQIPTFAGLIKDTTKELASLGYHQTPEITGPRDKTGAEVPIGRWREA